APNDVVRNFVPDQNAQGICACIAADNERDDRFGVADALRPACCRAIAELLEARHVDRTNSVLGRAALFNFFQWNGMPREISARPFRSPASRIGHGCAKCCPGGRGNEHRQQYHRSNAVSESQGFARRGSYRPLSASGSQCASVSIFARSSEEVTGNSRSEFRRLCSRAACHFGPPAEGALSSAT